MIKIIAGIVGFKKDGRIIPLTSADGAVDLGDPKREAKLVKNKIAVYADAASTSESESLSEDDSGDELPKYSKDMKLAKLQEIALVYGVDASNMRTKNLVIAAIDAAKAANEDDEDNEEQPDDESGGDEEQPDLNTANPEGATT